MPDRKVGSAWKMLPLGSLMRHDHFLKDKSIPFTTASHLRSMYLQHMN